MDGSRVDAPVQSNVGPRRPLAGGLGFGLLWSPMIIGARLKAEEPEQRAETAAERMRLPR